MYVMTSKQTTQPVDKIDLSCCLYQVCIYARARHTSNMPTILPDALQIILLIFVHYSEVTWSIGGLFKLFSFKTSLCSTRKGGNCTLLRCKVNLV